MRSFIVLIVAGLLGVMNGLFQIIPHYECVETRPFQIGGSSLGASGTYCIRTETIKAALEE